MTGNIKLSDNNKELSSFFTLFSKPIVFLSIIGIISIVIRLFYFPSDIPLVHDALNYFWYSIDLSITGEFPRVNPDIPTTKLFQYPNNGWPIFVSVFFSLTDSSNFIELMNLQRIISITSSIITIIPLYLLCRKFFTKKLSVIGVGIFSLHPLVIQNSLLGITEPLFILLGTICILFFLSRDYKIIIISFVVAALFTMVRYEGLIIFIPMSIIFIFRFRNSGKIILKYLLLASIFILILLPMAYLRTETIGHDGILSNVLGGTNYFVNATTQQSLSSNENSPIFSGIINFIKFSGMLSLPYLIFLIPYGFFKCIKKKNSENFTLIFISITMSLVAFYAYSRDIQEIRYLLILMPILSVISLYSIQKLFIFIKKDLIIIFLIFVILIISSLIYLEFTKIDYEYENDAYQFSKIVYEKTNIINQYTEDQYLRPVIAEFSNEFPKEKKDLPSPIKILSIVNFESIIQFIEVHEDDGLEYIVVDETSSKTEFLQEIYNNEKKYPFLEKIYDSSNSKYKVKLFWINYSNIEEGKDYNE